MPNTAPRLPTRSAPGHEFRPRRARRGALLLLGAALGLAGCQGLDLSKLPGPGDSGPVADDASPLSAQVQEALASAPATMHERIHIRSLQAGRVRLVGSVSSETVVSEAVRLADAVPGVTNVVDTLNVR